MKLIENFKFIGLLIDVWLQSSIVWVGLFLIGIIVLWRSSYGSPYKTTSIFLIITAIYWGVIDKYLSYRSGYIYCQLSDLTNSSSSFGWRNVPKNDYANLCEKSEFWGTPLFSGVLFIILFAIVGYYFYKKDQ